MVLRERVDSRVGMGSRWPSRPFCGESEEDRWCRLNVQEAICLGKCVPGTVFWLRSDGVWKELPRWYDDTEFGEDGRKLSGVSDGEVVCQSDKDAVDLSLCGWKVVSVSVSEDGSLFDKMCSCFREEFGGGERCAGT